MVPARWLGGRLAVLVLLAATAAAGITYGEALVDGHPPDPAASTSSPTPAVDTGAPSTTPRATASPTSPPTTTATAAPTSSAATPTPTSVDAASSGVSPWGGGPVVVAVANNATPERNVSALVAETIAYWETRDDRYAAYSADFVLRPDADDPDLIVRFADDVDCENPTAVGCAPRLNGSTRFDPPVTVWIKAGFNDRRTRRVLSHEFGHVLGIKHCQPPYAVMSHAHYCEPGTVPDAASAAERPLPWPDADLAVHVSDTDVAAGAANGTRDQIGHAVGYLDGGANGTLPANLSLTTVGDPWAADVAIRFSADPPCPGTGEAVCYRRSGPDYDNDGEMEFYTNATVILGTDVEVAARGWYAAWALAHLLGLEDDELPPPLADATYEERRSEWWA